MPGAVLDAIHSMAIKVGGIDIYMAALRAATPDEVLRDMYEEIISRDQAKKIYLSCLKSDTVEEKSV